MRVVSGLQSRINYTSVGLRPNFVFGQIGAQPGEAKRSVDAVSFDVMFNLSKLLSESPAILVILLDVAHALSLHLSDGVCCQANGSSVPRRIFRNWMVREEIRPRQASRVTSSNPSWGPHKD